MRKLCTLLLTLTMISCSNKIIHDPRGGKGEEVSMRYLDDKYSCEDLAKENTGLLSSSMLLLTGNLEYSYHHLVKECLRGRGHSIL